MLINVRKLVFYYLPFVGFARALDFEGLSDTNTKQPLNFDHFWSTARIKDSINTPFIPGYVSSFHRVITSGRDYDEVKINQNLCFNGLLKETPGYRFMTPPS